MAAKRGRKPQGPYADKTSTIATRVSTDLRDKLDRARQEHPRTWSLSQEIEHRLRLSFDEDEQIKNLFGSIETYAVARLFAEILNQVEGMTHRHWAEDGFTVLAASQAINDVLIEFRAGDDEAVPGHIAKYIKSPNEAGEAIAGGVLDQLRFADQALIDKPGRYYSDQAKLYARLKSALGDLGERLQ